MNDPVNHPEHYTSHPTGVECIDIVEHMPFNRGAAIKYIWRAGQKHDIIQDLEKARWFISREIRRCAKLREEAHVPEGTDAPGSQQVLPLDGEGRHPERRDRVVVARQVL